MGKFQLVNPVIIGTFNDTYETSSADQAAEKFWKTLTSENKYVTGNLPKFYFSLMDTGNNSLHHYVVKESINGSYANYSIKKADVKMSSKQKDDFLAEVSRVRSEAKSAAVKEQSGGRRRHDDSSSSDSDSELDDLFRHVRLRNLKTPISYWWFYPKLYETDVLFTPTFVAPVSPYVQLWVPM